MGGLFGREAITSRGRWLAIISASLLLQLPYWVAVFAFAASHDGQPVPGTPVLFALGFVPLVFLLLAFVSRNPGAPGGVLKAMGLFLLVTPVVALLNPVVGVVAGFGAGGIVTLRRPELPRDQRTRLIALVVGCVYLYVLLVVVGAAEFAIVTGAALPFAVLGIADELGEGRHLAAERREADRQAADRGD
jgi:hypothetical protein